VRRFIVVALATVALAACSSSERPAGIVERWLLALNQGSAGQPERYARSAVSDQVLPGYAHADPGELDVIEVGGSSGARYALDGSVAAHHVPFRVVRVDGVTIEGRADVAPGVSGLRVVAFEVDMPLMDGSLPSTGGVALAQASAIAWLAAVAAGVGLALAGEGAMRQVRVPRRD
jgi:hypothetical protein